MARMIRVVALNGAMLGTLTHVVAERGSTRPSGLVLRRSGEERVLPLTAVRAAGATVIHADWPADGFASLPAFVRAAYRVIDEEMEMQAELDEDFQVGAEEDEDEIMLGSGPVDIADRELGALATEDLARSFARWDGEGNRHADPE